MGLQDSHGEKEHREKAQHDLKIAEKMLNNNNYPDWVVICSFYSALHYVDAFAHKLGKTSFKPRLGEKITAHRKRELFVRRHMKEFFASYKRLHDRSTQARYDPEYYKLMFPKIPSSAVKSAKRFESIK